MKSSNPKNNNPKGNPITLTPHKPKWKNGKTKTIRVPIVIADKVLAAAKLIDEGESNSAIATTETTTNSAEAIQILLNALKLKANAGGAIKSEIRKALKLMNVEY